MNNELTTLEQRDWTEFSDPPQLPANPVVSVLMLTYNHGPYLAEAIEGVVNQKTDFPVELLIGEDCSKDNTLQVARDYQKRYPQIIRVLHACPNSGVAENFRRLIRACKGEFAAFCEGDDYWIDQRKLADQIALIRDNAEISIVHADHVVRHDFWGRRFIVQPRGRYADYSDKGYLAGDISEKCFGGLVTHTSTVLCRSQHLKEYLAIDLAKSLGFAYDCCVVNYLALRGQAAYLDRPVSAYRITPGSMMRSGARGNQKMAVEIRDFFMKFAAKHHKYVGRRDAIYKDYTLTILKSAFRLADSECFCKAAQELQSMSLSTIEQFTLKWHMRLFNIGLMRSLFTYTALFVQSGRKIRHMAAIYAGMVERVTLAQPKLNR